MYGLQSGSSAGYRPQAPTPLAGSPPGGTPQYLAHSYGNGQAQYKPYQPSPSPAFGTQSYAPLQPQPSRYTPSYQTSSETRPSAYGDRYYQPSAPSGYSPPSVTTSTGMSSYSGSSTIPTSTGFDGYRSNNVQPVPARSAYPSSSSSAGTTSHDRQQSTRPSYESSDSRPVYEYDYARSGSADPRSREHAPAPEVRTYQSSHPVNHEPIARTPELVKLPQAQPMQARTQPQSFRSAAAARSNPSPAATEDINERSASFLQRRAREGTAPAAASYRGGGKEEERGQDFRSASRDADGRESAQSGRQNLVGVGIVFQQYDDGKMYVKSLVKGEAASLADPRPLEGDCIVGVDDQDVSFCDLAHLRTLVIGRPSTAVILRLIRPNGQQYETVVIRGSKADQHGGRISAAGSVPGDGGIVGGGSRHGGDRKGVLSPSSERDRVGSPYDMYGGRQSADRGAGAGTDAAMERARQEINKMRGGSAGTPNASMYGSREGESYAGYAGRGAGGEGPSGARYDERYRRREAAAYGDGPSSARGVGGGLGDGPKSARGAGPGYREGAGGAYRGLASPSSAAGRDHSGRSRSADPPQWRGDQEGGGVGRGAGAGAEPRRPASSLATAMQRLQEELQDSRARAPPRHQPGGGLSGIREGGGLYGSRDGKDTDPYGPGRTYARTRPAGGTPTGGYAPSGTPTGSYQPSGAPSGGYQPSASSGYQPSASSGYQPSASSGYQPSASGGYQPGNYQPSYQPGRYQSTSNQAPSPGHYGGADIYNSGDRSYGAGGVYAAQYGRRY